MNEQEFHRVIRDRNAKIYELECQIAKMDELEEQLEEANQKIVQLRDTLQAVEKGGDCQCMDWYSAGYDPESGNKLKCCNDCGLISVR